MDRLLVIIIALITIFINGMFPLLALYGIVRMKKIRTPYSEIERLLQSSEIRQLISEMQYFHLPTSPPPANRKNNNAEAVKMLIISLILVLSNLYISRFDFPTDSVSGIECLMNSPWNPLLMSFCIAIGIYAVAARAFWRLNNDYKCQTLTTGLALTAYIIWAISNKLIMYVLGDNESHLLSGGRWHAILPTGLTISAGLHEYFNIRQKRLEWLISKKPEVDRKKWEKRILEEECPHCGQQLSATEGEAIDWSVEIDDRPVDSGGLEQGLVGSDPEKGF